MSILKKIFKNPSEETPFLEEINELETLLQEKDKKIQILETDIEKYKSKTIVDEKMLSRLESQLKSQKNEIDILRRKNDMLLKKDAPTEDDEETFKDELNKFKEFYNSQKDENKRLEDRLKKVCIELETAKKNRVDEQTIRNLKKVTEEFLFLKEENARLKKDNSDKASRIKYLESSSGFVAFDFANARYMLMIKDLYEARKYDDFKKACINSKIVYVEELNDIDFEDFAEKNEISDVKMENAKAVYEDYKSGNIPSDLQEYMMSGHLASKVFFRFRSFVKYLDEKSIKYMSDLEGFDFNSLKDNDDFNDDQIKKFVKKYNEYNQLRKIK